MLTTSNEWDNLWEDRDISEDDLALEDDNARSSNFYTTSTKDDYDAILDFKKANNLSGKDIPTSTDDEYESWKNQFLEDRDEIVDDNMQDVMNKDMRNNLTRR